MPTKRDLITGRMVSDTRSPDDRLRESIMAEQNSGCWLWLGAINDEGYGVTQLNGIWTIAHRASYIVFVGDIPPDAKVCHKCDTPACINPAHLFVGDQQANISDMEAKGRRVWAKNILTHEQVREIRNLAASGVPIREITRRFPIKRPAIKKVIARKSYNYVN